LEKIAVVVFSGVATVIAVVKESWPLPTCDGEKCGLVVVISCSPITVVRDMKG
jgi:hypothetical protein